MAASCYALQMTDRTPAKPGDSEELSLLVLYAGAPVGAVTFGWHGELEFSLTASKFFGGKSPGIDNAWQLANLVRRAVETESPGGITDAANLFGQDGEDAIWEINIEPGTGTSTQDEHYE